MWLVLRETSAVLVVFGGLPGTGKSTLSRAVALRLRATWLRVDAIESAMWRAGVERDRPTGLAAYVVANTVADAQLGLGATVVADAVNPVEAARAGWRQLAESHRVALRVIEVTCSDPEEHRRRVERRVPARDQPCPPGWEQVLARDYEAWAEPRLAVDTMEGEGECLKQIMEFVRSS
ncbi:AAA family ATPase [Actinomadura sp. 1N219]|uniref:AAA family ATPase n=1 Tax=Actinomadura sp. 1N219 TaxID=3375152 RepID=UPI0037B6F283